MRAVVRAVETKTVSIREVAGGTAFGHVPRRVEKEEVVTRELDVQAVMEQE